ncbi:MAG: glycosyltransferase family 4 protein [Tepidisphaeraceae bacterium]|jgi:glycosyltransferase involved in cell wall biosynthesis
MTLHAPTDSPVTACGDSQARKIAWLVSGQEVFGVKRAVVNLASAVRKSGWEVRAVCLNPGESARALTDAEIPTTILNVGPAPSLHLHASRLRRLLTLGKMFHYVHRIVPLVGRALSAERPDAIHIVGSNLLPVAGRVAHKLGAAVFWEITTCLGGNYPFRLNQRLYQWVVRHFDILPLPNSRYTASSLGSPPFHSELLYIGADENTFNPDTVIPISRSVLNIPSDAVVLLAAGRLDPSKGLDRVLQAVVSLSSQPPDIHIVALGNSPDKDFENRLRQLAASAGIASRLHILGHVDNPQCYYHLADLGISNGLVPESFGLSVVECMMMGRPVIAHAYGGPAETVLDGATGYLTSTPNSGDVVLALRRALADRARWAEIGARARRRALENFSLSAQVSNYMRIVRARLQQFG